jgi:carbon-monoxide dehydrogenase medium subunit
MHAFEYCAPEDLQEALRVASSASGTASFLAGGTDLIVGMRVGRRNPRVVIDVKKIPLLTEIQRIDDDLTLGAAASCRSVYQSPLVSSAFPALVDSASLIGGIQIQGRATLGGNLCNAAPSADTVPALIAYRASAVVDGPRGTRTVPVEDFCVAPGRTSLAPDELLVRLVIPWPARSSGAMFIRFTPRNEMDIAVVNAAANVELDPSRTVVAAARIAIGSVAPRPLYVAEAGQALVGRPVTDDSIEEAAAISQEVARPITDMRGTIEHRRQLVRVLVARAIRGAFRRAKGEVA